VDEMTSIYGDDVNDICTQLFGYLMSMTASDVLQTEVRGFWIIHVYCVFQTNVLYIQLLDLLGFERFELLSQILQYRADLVDEYQSLVVDNRISCELLQFEINNCCFFFSFRCSSCSSKAKEE
jgi:hypothetical protein